MVPLLLVLAVLLLSVALPAPGAPDAPLYSRREALLTVRAPDGTEKVVRSESDWRRRREHILANMQRVMGPVPGPEKRVPLDVRIESEQREEKYTRTSLSYASAPGERVPALLLVPHGLTGRAPAILALHQTVKIGKDEPAGLGGSANLHYAKELAERGYVVLAPDYPTLGRHELNVYERGWVSCTMKAIWDNMRALDLLQSLPQVDGARIGALGHSLGGHNTLFTAAFDARIQVAITSCGFTAFSKYYGGNLTGWMGERYMPRIRTHYPTPAQMPFDFHDVLAAIAPRALMICAPVRDANFEVSGVREVVAAVTPVYELLGRPERLQSLYPDCAHDWPLDTRGAAYAWMDRWLARSPADRQ